MIWSVLEVVGDWKEKGIDCWSSVNHLHEMIRFRDQCLGKDQQWVLRQKNTVGQNILLDQGAHKDFSLPNLPPFPPQTSQTILKRCWKKMVTGSNIARSLGNLYSADQNPIKSHHVSRLI